MTYLGTKPIAAPTPGARSLHRLHHHSDISGLCSMLMDRQHDYLSLLRWPRQQETARLNGTLISPPAQESSGGVLI